jgi:hypothetical protein
MTETTYRKRGGRAFHSVLESHFDFIHQLRQRRKTWKEIAELLFTEKGIRVTFHAPYLFYRRRLKRATKPHWEDAENNSQSQPARPNAAASRPQSRQSPLPQQNAFNRPNLSKINTDQEFT